VSDDTNAYNKKVNKRMAAELAEVEDPIISGQLQLDRWWQLRLDDAAAYRKMMRELNPVGLLIWD